MITPKDFKVEDFISAENARFVDIIREEALMGSELVDNLILLKFCDLYSIQTTMKTRYNLPFVWLNMDPTPSEFRALADKHGVLIARGRNLVIYIPLGATVDDALLQVDIPNYQLVVQFIADCNYRVLKTGIPVNTLSYKLAAFRPLLVFKRLVIDAIERAGTDIHFLSRYVNKQPDHVIQYRIKREMVNAEFKLDKEMMQSILQAVIGKLSMASAADLDAPVGVVTDVTDLFHDGTCDLRITGMKNDAGYDSTITIQTTTTTNKTINQLGFPQDDVDLLRQIAKRRTGLTLITGEMRSGKNTTIFAMLNEIVEDPIRIVEYSNPIENHMSFSQINYRGDISVLKENMKLAKKQDIDVAVLNEIPNAEVAFAVRDLVNSAIGVITTTHINRIWHLPNKLREFFGDDYKTIISQLNAVVNHKMFRRWSGPSMQRRTLVKEHGEFEMFCYTAGVRQYYVPEDPNRVRFELQPLTEIMVFTDSVKTALLNFDELWKAEQLIQLNVQKLHATLENKCAAYINEGVMPLDEMRRLF